MNDKVTYAIVRIESNLEPDVVTARVQETLEILERKLGALTRIDTYNVQSVTTKQDEEKGGPVLCWP